MDFVWVALGGALGACARYQVGAWVVARFEADFPLHTLLINVTGSLAVGALVVLLTERVVADPAWRLLLVVGFLGGYTTFSTYTFEAVALLQAGHWARGLGYILGSNVLGLIAVSAGMVFAKIGFDR